MVVGTRVFDLLFKYETEVVDTTPNSVCILMKKRKKQGITCTQWFALYPDWKDQSSEFTRRFTLVN